MNEWKVVDQDTGDVWYKDSRREAEEAVEEFSMRDLEIEGPDDTEDQPSNDNHSNPVEETDGGTEEIEAEVIDHTKDTNETEPEPAQEPEPIPESKPDLNEDPVDWMPSHFVDNIQGVPTLNRKGYAVMAERFDVSVTSEPVVRASETDFEYAEFQAVATTADGEEYSGFGSAHIDRGDGDDEFLLNELAETRAMKRAASWALGLGMTAKEEMENTL